MCYFSRDRQDFIKDQDNRAAACDIYDLLCKTILQNNNHSSWASVTFWCLIFFTLDHILYK